MVRLKKPTKAKMDAPQRRGIAAKVDPTRTVTIRRAFARKLRQRFARLRLDLIDLIVTHDAFGLSPLPRVVLNKEKVKYASTQFNVTDSQAVDELNRIQSQLDPADVVELEDKPHVTVRYGLLESDSNAARVQQIVKGYGDVYAKVGGLSVFFTPDAEVLKFDVLSPRLHDLNRKIGLLPNVQTQPTYIPHMTVAYLKKSTSYKYLSLYQKLTGTTLNLSEFVYSDKDRNKEQLTVNAPNWRFDSDAKKLEEFRRWLEERFQQQIVGAAEDKLWNDYIMDGFRKGAGRAFDDWSRRQPESYTTPDANFLGGSKFQFMKQSFAQPESIDKVKLLAERTFNDIRNVTDDMRTRMGRTLLDGLVQGSGPREVAKNLDADLGIGQARSEVIARTEFIRAHAEGQLMSMKALGVEKVGVQVEWSTANDGRVCPKCEMMQGTVLSIADAHGKIPLHPNCRCTWIPLLQDDDDGDLGKAAADDYTASGVAPPRSMTGNVEKPRPRPSKVISWMVRNGFVRREADPPPIDNDLLDFNTALNSFCATGVGGGVDPSCSSGQSGGGSESSTSTGGFSGLLTSGKAVVASVKTALYNRLPAPLKKVVDWGQHVEHKLEGVYKGTQAVARQLAKDSGMSEKGQDRLNRILAITDGVSRWTANVPAAHHALDVLASIGGPAGIAAAKSAYYMPVASLGYVGFKMGKAAVTGKNPVAMIVRARKAVKAEGSKVHNAANDVNEAARRLAEWLTPMDEDQQEWAEALISAALDETQGDLAAALIIAQSKYDPNDATNEAEEGV